MSTVKENFDNIIRGYKDTGLQFVDTEFPANSSSIGNLPEIEGEVRWLRPKEIKTGKNNYKGGEKSSEFISHLAICAHIQPSDVSQGTLGNCWFLSSIAVVAARPELIHKLIQAQNIPAGAYRFQLCKDGMWTSVIVDDLLPCDEDHQLLFAKAKDKQFWVCLLEKAHAKLYGSYEALQSGHALEGLVALTGFPAESIDFQAEPEDLASQNQLWQTLLFCYKAGFLIGMCCGRPEITEDDYEKIGLLSSHAYSVLQVRSVSKLRLLHIRNPWGKYRWKGDWNIESKLWTPELISKLKPPKHDDGTFWISFQDILKYFRRADICQIRPKWHENRFEGTFINKNSLEITCYKIHVTKPTELEYALYQPSKRSKQKDGHVEEDIQLDISMILVSLELNALEERHFKIKRYVGSSPRELSSCVIGKLRGSILQPGKYALVPFSIKSLCGDENSNKYALSIHSSSEILVEACVAPLTFLTDCMIEFATKSGQKRDYTESVKLYVKRFWSGMLLVIENNHPEKYLRIATDLRASQNIHCSRATPDANGLEIFDVVPPSFRQVLTILTTSSKLYDTVMSHKVKYSHGSTDCLGNFAQDEEDYKKRHLPELVTTLHQPQKIQLC